jgi:hypothetical protein
MSDVHSILIRKLKEHSRLTREDLGAIQSWRHKLRNLAAHEDLIRQGDDPDVSAVVVSGTVARYHFCWRRSSPVRRLASPFGARHYRRGYFS